MLPSSDSTPLLPASPDAGSAFQPLPPLPPEQFPTLRSEDGRVTLTNEGL
jgi:hypothetical protein